MSKLSALIFDWDGTIADTLADQFFWLKHCCESFGKSFPYETLTDGFRNDYNRYFSARGILGLYDMIGVDFNANKPRIWSEYEAWKKNAKICLFAGMKEVIAEIYARSRPRKGSPCGMRFALNTTSRLSTIENVFFGNGLQVYFDTLLTRELLPESESATLTKPHVYSIEWCLDLLGRNADETLHVGDTVTDIVACRTLRRKNPANEQNVKTVAVTWGYETRQELEKVKPDYIVDRPSELVKIVETLCGFD